MGLGAPGGTGPGEGGFGGGLGGLGGFDAVQDSDYISLNNPRGSSAAINAALDEAFGEVDAASADIGSVGHGGVVGNIARGAAILLSFVATGSVPVSVAIDNLVKRGIDKVSAMRAVSKAQHHASMLNDAGEHSAGIESAESFAMGLASDLAVNSGGPEKIKQRAVKEKYVREEKANNENANPSIDNSRPLGPKGNPKGDFWKEFVYEWQGAKDYLQKNQDFKQAQLAPVFDTYQKRLSGLSNESTFKPITVGMGDFKTSFMPRRSMTAADKILGSELAETDVMLPNTARLQYLDKLKDVAQWKKALDKKKLPNTQRRPDDQGTWLDAIGDVMKIGSSAADIYSKVTG